MKDKRFQNMIVSSWSIGCSSRIDSRYVLGKYIFHKALNKKIYLCKILNIKDVGGNKYISLLFMPESAIPSERIFGNSLETLKLKSDIWLAEKGFSINKIG